MRNIYVVSRIFKEDVGECRMVDKCSCSGGNGQHNTLLCPPGNLKECIDWILRLTGKDKVGGGNGDNGKKLGEEVAGLLKKDKAVLETVTTSLKNGSGSNLITELADNLKKFIGYENGGGTGKLNGNGIGNKGAGAKGTEKYTSSYKDSATWDKAKETDKDGKLCAAIFLGTIPVIFSGLSYLYWQCNEGNGSGDRWSTQYIHDTSNALGIYFVCCGYDLTKLNQKKAEDVGTTCFQQFTEFNNGTNASNNNYPEYIKEVLTKTSPTSHPLSSLYLASQYYFQSQFNDGTRVPTTIREMLYWLMALPYSSCFQLAPATIQQGITKHGSDSIPFDDDENITLDSDTDPFDCYMSTTCHYAAVVLSTIQGKLCTPKTTSTTTTDTSLAKPQLNLHNIYSNSHFKFNYPDNPSDWFNKLWDVVYHLLSQLYFLKGQCRTCVGSGCGWLWCKYGDGINSHMTKEVESWICTANPCNGNHTSGSTCKSCHTDHPKKCGQSDNHSPLQAFLCDLLTPFKCPKSGETNKYPSYTEHISHRNFNQYCSVPMGFNKDCLSHTDRTGDYLFKMLDYFTEKYRDHVSCYNITLFLLIVCQRTPRTVGDLFCFFLNLGENMNNGSSTTVAQAIQKESTQIPWSNGYKNITEAAKKLGEEHPEDHESEENANLNTLRYSDCGGETCGQYLDPLSFVIYSNISVVFAGTYLKWIIYLTHALKEGLEELHKDFQKLKCDHGKQRKCSTGCHGKDECQCTFVECSEVLGLLYSYGLHYYYPEELHSSTKKKRTCAQFSTELKNLLDVTKKGKPFSDLLSAINLFVTFWLLTIIYLTYSLTIPLDVLHLRSTPTHCRALSTTTTHQLHTTT
ncbi:uncharacterized protein BXIN_2425 [Babesia sp. Xinjiang]|uniref:uncharacterized protein n=1 Tax=Babesia sp. Xinjiang TaxID=462227 RepID=UPI000A235355|nr:uncharacterized protein BXIN_2425 [Babesia sp. Xinjiang]ORM41663.1 hypothetical protein BXIN_2425 [Babesia sp. Xinjiang]